jgi:uncharacterized protein (DUF342 family)
MLARTLFGKYELEEEIGRGGMGVVYRARDLALGRPVAVKELLLQPLGSVAEQGDMVARFRREAQTAGRLQHPNITALYDFGEDEQQHYMVMELLEGFTLKYWIDQRKTLSLNDGIGLLLQLCAGLEYAHRQRIIHRDIKPENILITHEQHLKIMDFGIARLNDPDSLVKMTQEGSMLGTLAYMSPEQLQDASSVDHRADIFSVGVLMYELFTSQLPFEGASMGMTIMKIISEEPVPPANLNRQITPRLEQIILKALAKRRPQRYQTMLELGEDLQLALSELAPAPLDEAPPVPVSAGVVHHHPTLAVQQRQTGRIPDLSQSPAFHLSEDPPPPQRGFRQHNRWGVTVEISPDQLTAWLEVDATYSPEPIDENKLRQSLRQAGLIEGIDESVLQKALTQGYLERTLVALGTPPQHGQDGWIDYLVEEAEQGPQMREDGTVDYLHLNLVVTVSVGAPLIRRYNATRGIPGFTVTGEPIPARNGAEKRFSPGAGVGPSSDDANLFVAERPGRPVRTPTSIRIDDTITLDEVNVRTGHIDFDGTVVVKGNVNSGLRIRASGDIVVLGTVEDCVLEAGGNLHLRGSVFGGGNTRLQARGDIFARYLQQAHLQAQGSLTVEEGLIHCQTQVWGRVRIGEGSSRGQLNGGQLICGGPLQVRVLGSTASTPTRIILGCDPAQHQLLGQQEQAWAKGRQQLEELIKAIIYLRTSDPGRSDQIQQLENKRQAVSLEVNGLQDEVQYLRDRLRQAVDASLCQVQVADRLFAGVHVQLPGAQQRFQEDLAGPMYLREILNDRRERIVFVSSTAGGAAW